MQILRNAGRDGSNKDVSCPDLRMLAGMRLASVLPAMILALLIGPVRPANAQAGCGVPPVLNHSGAARDYPIPVDASGTMTFTCKGGDGGDAVLNNSGSFGAFELCRSRGGKGAVVNATFAIGTGVNELQPGGTLRFVVGAAGQTGESLVNIVSSGSEYGGGGGGSALLYRPPGNTGNSCTDWSFLMVAGGGGGAHQGALLNTCIGGRDGANVSLATQGTAGGGPNAGAGGVSGNGGGCGDNAFDNEVSGGGGGALSGGESCAASESGGQGCPNGAAGGNIDRDGGFGFGGGGGSNGAGGGGGGYSGGGGGSANHGGGGGGSFVATSAISPSLNVSGSQLGNGRITWEATPNFFVNDTCATAIPISDGSFVGCTTSATFTTFSSCSGGVDIWYSYTNTSDCDRQVFASMFNDVPNTSPPVGIYRPAGLAVYDACGGTELACDSPIAMLNPYSEVSWVVPAGATHYIQVSSVEAGQVRLGIRSEDSLLNRIEAPVTLNGSTVGQPASGLSSCFGSLASPDVTYPYINLSGVPEQVTASTCGAGTNFDTVLSILEACSGQQVICDADVCGEHTTVTWTAKPDVRYLIRVAGENGATGDYQLDVTAAPANDLCTNPIPLGGFAEFEGLLATASPSGVGGDCAPSGEKDIWFSYTHDDPDGCPKFVEFTLNNSSNLNYELFLDCGIPLDRGSSCLTVQAVNSIQVLAGETLLLRVSGTGNEALLAPYSFTVDDGAFFGYQQDDSGLPLSMPIGFSDDAGDVYPTPACGNTAGKGKFVQRFVNQLGYRIRIKADTCGPDTTDTVLSASRFFPFAIDGTYDACEYEELACDDNGASCGLAVQSELFVDVEPGELIDFVVRKNTFGTVSATLNLTIDTAFPPDNDNCADAIDVSDGVVYGVNQIATSSGPASSCAPASGAGMWYRYTNTSLCAVRVTADTCADDTDFETVLTAFDACGGAEVACATPTLGCLGGSVLTWTIEAGATGLLRVSSADPATTRGRFRLDISSEAIDPFGFGFPGTPCEARNDLCVNAFPLVDGVQPGTLANATHDLNPTCADTGDLLEDVWYTYTNPASCPSKVTISTCLSDGSDVLRSLSAFDSCAGTELACDSGDANEPCATITWTVPVGATQLVRCSRTPGSTTIDEFTLSVSSIGAADRDGDGIEDACDNCLDVPNPAQADADADGAGDDCDLCPGFDDSLDADVDSVPDGCDQCPGFDDLLDTDGDGVADGCDTCPNDNPDDLDGNGTCGAQVVNEGFLQSGVMYTGDLQPPAAIADQACATDQPGTFDFWTFDAVAGDTITIELDRLDPDLDPTMSLWAGDLVGTPLLDFTSPTANVSQTLVTVPPDIEPPATVINSAPQGPGSDPALVGFVAPLSGTYTVLVAGNCDSVADDNTYSIRLDLNAEAIIRNVTQSKIYQLLEVALFEALSGDEIEISAGIIYDDGVVFPNGLNVTIRGAGRGVTIIDAESDNPTAPVFFMSDSGQTSATVISDLTVRKDADVNGALGALYMRNVSPIIRNVSFEGNYGSAGSAGGIDVTVSGVAAAPVLKECLFLDARAGFASVEVLDGANITLINCAFDQSTRLDASLITSLSTVGGSVNLVNCTVGGLLDHGAAAVDAVNTAFLMSPPAGFTLNYSLFPGATGNNIDGTPTFVDEPNNDLRLTAASLGVDAADYDAYVAADGDGLDAAGASRAFDEPNTTDIGVGALQYLDIGAYEFVIDSDDDGVDDGLDVCPGFDDNLDADGDGTPDGCDACPNDLFDDSDGDGVCDSDDVCPGQDDTIDTDGDTIPDCAEPVGDECPFYLDVGNGTVTGNLQGYSGGTGDDSSCALNDAIDQWFRYVSTIDGTLSVSACNSGTEFDTVLSIFDGCPESGGLELACVNDAALPECDLGGLNRLSAIVLPATIGQVFYVRLSVFNDDFSGSGGFGTGYELTFLAEGDGDECEIARVAASGVTTGSLEDNTGLTGEDDSCGTFNTVDEWFAYTAPRSGQATISTCSTNTGFDSTLSLFSDCPSNGGVELACNDNDAAGPPECGLDGFTLLSTLQWNVTVGETYYVRVTANFDAFEPFGPEFDLILELTDSVCSPTGPAIYGALLFPSLCTQDASVLPGGPGDPYLYNNLLLPFFTNPADRFYLSSTSDAFAPLVVDDSLHVNSVDSGLGPYSFESGVPPFKMGQPIEENLIPEPAQEVTSLIPEGHSVVLFELIDTQREIYGNTAVFLVQDCGIHLEQDASTLIHYVTHDDQVASLPPNFDIRSGLLSELHADRDFSRAACIGAFANTPALDGRPDPAPGNGYYYLARGLSSCVAQGYGFGKGPDPDLRALLPACP